MHLWYAVPFFFLALLSKESAIALLPTAFVMLYVEKKKWPSGVEWAWLAVCGVCFAAYFALRQDSIADAGNFSVAAFFSNLRSLPEEMFKMMFPLGYSVMPGYQLMWTLAGVVVIGAMVYFARKYKIQKRTLWTGLAITLFSLLPSMVYEPSFAGVAYDYLDHRTWFPFVGIWLIILSIIDASRLTGKKNAWVYFMAILIVWSGVNIWRIGTYAGWQPYYTNAISTNPGSGLANLNYGSMLRDEGRWEEALPYVEKGVQLSPDYTDAKVRLAEVYFNLKKYPEAIEISNQALTKEPNNISALQFRGSALGASGQPAQAMVDFQKILELDPENRHGIFNLAMAQKDAGQLPQVVETLTRLINIQPDFPNAYYERGFSYGRMGMFSHAHDDMEKSIQYQPQHGASYFFRGRTFEAMGNQQAACADFRKALELGTVEAEVFVREKCGG
jgi:Tfp pilus assembly protein PilF